MDPSTTFFSQPSPWPFGFAPTGFTMMMHAAGEPAVAAVAARAGIPYSLSILGTTSIEDLVAAVPAGRKWFQLYLSRDRGINGELVCRARAAGYETLMLTVDAPVGGARLRDVRNGLTIPPSLTLRTFVEGALHPGWWFDLLTTEPLEFALLTLQLLGVRSVAELAPTGYGSGKDSRQNYSIFVSSHGECPVTYRLQARAEAP